MQIICSISKSYITNIRLNDLCFYRSIAQNGVKMLRKGGALYFEIYEQFGEQIRQMLEQMGYKDIVVAKDIFGKERMVWSRR